MLTKLTPQQEEKMREVKQYWLDYIFSCKNSIDREAAKIKIEWIYKFCKLSKPVIIYLDSPLACQYGAHLIKQLFKNAPAQVRAQVGTQVRDQVGAQVGTQVWAQVRAQVGTQVWAQVRAQVRAQVGAQVGTQVRDQKIQFEYFCDYGSIRDFGWVSFFDFFTQIGVINHEGFNEFKSLLQCGIYDTIQLQGFCIVSDLPKKISRNNRNRLHCEDGPAIQFKDGYSQYYWNGVSVPESWITHNDLINKETILAEGNAERRRCLREIVGASRYFELLGGVDLIDEDVDGQGNPMKLYQTKKVDDVIGKKVQFLEVICPSTQRMYNLYPPNQQSKNVWEAKASTFRNEKIQVRHGDVGLLNLQKEFSKPVLES
jgi:hypothetical protein